MPTLTSTKNPITRAVVVDTWNNVNRIARTGNHTLLYRDAFNEDMIEQAKDELVESWSGVKITQVGDESERILIIELMV